MSEIEIQNNPSPESLEIRDLSIASYLYSISSLQFAGYKKLQNGDFAFMFVPRVDAEKLITRYWNMSAPCIQPKLLFSAQRDLKDIIFRR
jgi:hypothetical protein